MPSDNDLLNAQAKLEAALTDYLRYIKGDTEGIYFLQDYVIGLVSENMAPGNSNKTFFNFTAPPGRAKYLVRGLLTEAMDYFKSTTRTNDL